MGTVAAIAALLPFVITSVEQVDELIQKLQDHKRTLAQADADQDAADAKLDADLSAGE